jgi:hypothetical protein
MSNFSRGKIVSILLVSLVWSTILPSTIAINIQKNETCESVDANIYLTREILPLLKKALNQLQNQQIQKLLQQMILILTNKELITSDDIREILNGFENCLNVRTGLLISVGSGEVLCFPGLYLSALLFYCGPVLIGTWDGKGFTRAGSSVYYDCDGCFLGFLGFIKYQYSTMPMHSPPNDYRYIYGVSSLIIITS